MAGTPNHPIKSNIFSKKVCLVPQKLHGAENSYRSYTTEIAGVTLNKIEVAGRPNHPIKSNFPKKFMFSLSEVKRSQISYGSYPTEFAGSTQNPKKMAGTPNKTIKTEMFPKKSLFSTLK
jgi:hypothetical protein